MNYGPELVYFWARSLKEHYIPSFIDRIEGGEHWVALKLSHSRNWLFLSWHSITNGCCIVTKEDIDPLIENSKRADPVLLFLRKYILRSRLVRVEQAYGDRILSLSFERTLGAGFRTGLTLNLECTGNRSNMIVIDDNNIIRETARHINPEINRYRTVLPGIPYSPPPPFKGLALADLSCGELKDSLSRLKGIGTPLSRSILRVWDTREPHEWMSLLKLIFETNVSLSDFRLISCGNYVTVFPEILEGCKLLSHDILEGSKSIISDLMRDRTRMKLYKQSCEILDILILRKQKHMEGLLNQITNAKRADYYKMAGELLMANSYRLKKGITHVQLSSWDDPAMVVDLTLDPRLSIIQNAQKYFRKFKKSTVSHPEQVEAKIAGLRDSIQELNEQKELLGIIEDTALLREATQDISGWINAIDKKRPRSKKYVPPHIRLNFLKHQILVGVNAKGNRYVTFRLAHARDLWFHVHEIPGAHVILKETEQSDPSETETAIKVAASLAAYYSRAKNTLKVQIDYTEKKNVRHISGSGIAHVTYSNPETILINPDLWKEYFSDRQ